MSSVIPNLWTLNVLTNSRAPVVPLREYTIMDIVNSITDKPDWHRKIFDSDIAAKWREEILNPDFQGPSANESRRAQPRSENQPNFEGEDIDENEDEDEDESTGNSDPDPTRDLDVDMLSPESSQWSAESNGFDISDKMADWAIAEAKYKAELFKQSNCVEALDGVWKSDTIIPEGLRLALRKAVEPLENVEDVSRLSPCFGFTALYVVLMILEAHMRIKCVPHASHHRFFIFSLCLPKCLKRYDFRI